MKKKPRGRPKLPPKDRKSRYLQLRIGNADLHRLRQAADARSLPLSEWARAVLLRAAKR